MQSRTSYAKLLEAKPGKPRKRKATLAKRRAARKAAVARVSGYAF
jgi:hypothetical protein